MLALYRADRQTDSLRAYGRVRQLLAEELGLAPGEPLRSLEQAILMHDSRLIWTASPSQERSIATSVSIAGPMHTAPVASGDLVQRREPARATARDSRVVVRPSGTVTFLFTDVERSTELWDHDADGMRMALARHDQMLQEAIEAHGGYVFSRSGDGVAVAFERAGDALAAAIEAQRALLAERWPPDLGLRVRMGLHTGQADERDGDYVGPPVNRAARLMSAANGGQVVVSATTADLLWPVTGVELTDVGVHRLRGISDPIQVFGVWADGLPWLDRPLRTSRTALGNLPVPVNEWFGQIATLQRQVAGLRSHRLVTLTGTGGVGKTRLALEMATVAADEFVDGVWIVELAPVGDPDAVAPAVASTLSIRPQEGLTVVESIVDWLRGRRVLLLLDNCEHVLAHVGDLVAAIVPRCATVTVMATSREPLSVSGERVVPVAPLATSNAVALFCDRAEAVDDSLAFSATDRAAIVGICEQLDGIPLAIELAAARVRSLTPGELQQRLGDRLRLLRARRGDSGRHTTLRATVAWSYQLLSVDERLLFDRISVFAGGFDVAAVEAICGRSPLDTSDVFDLVASLVDKSMVIADRGDDGTRYRVLETLRQFAAERLDEGGEVGALRDRHLSHYVAVAQQANRLWASRRQLDGSATFEREWDNLRAAHGWAIATTDLDAAELIVAATGRHARARGRDEHGDWAERTLGLSRRHDTPTAQPTPGLLEPPSHVVTTTRASHSPSEASGRRTHRIILTPRDAGDG
jgi:predicted ATPase/class 3 adenylate cyclase